MRRISHRTLWRGAGQAVVIAALGAALAVGSGVAPAAAEHGESTTCAKLTQTADSLANQRQAAIDRGDTATADQLAKSWDNVFRTYVADGCGVWGQP